MTDASETTRRPWVFALFLLLAGGIGWIASFALAVEKFHVLENPEAVPSCDISPLVQCGANLASWQGAVFFGVPNPVWGVAGFVAPIAVGTALLAGARFERWFWMLFHLGVAGALAFVIWLITQSITVLGTLCPWCMVVWTVTIPLFWALTARNLAEGVYGSGARRVGTALQPWVVPITVVSYLVVAIVAQLTLDVLGRVF